MAALSISLSAQNVTGLQGEAKNNLLRLTWVDSVDARGPVYIYRSVSPFEPGTDLSILGRLIKVPYGVQSYIDEVEFPGTWYYFVAASDTEGQRFELPLPPDNSIGIEILESSDRLAVSPAAPPAEIAHGGEPGVNSLSAAVEGDSVIVTFRAEDRGRAVVLYRSARPLKQARDLVGAVIVQPDIASPFIDYPVPGIPYYYAVIFEDDLTRGTAALYPGRNATVEAVEVPQGSDGVGLSSSASIRSLPLPMISLAAAVPGMNAFDETPSPVELSPEASKALEDLEPVQRKSSLAKSPRAFSQDLEAPGGGEEYALYSIMQDFFLKKDWDGCRNALAGYLGLPRSSASEARARFYLGQCYYFLGQPRESLFEFLSAQPAYPDESAEWIQASLAALVK
ncbi:conserved hypothetical protein [Leadbettera azotonutricia ZAS-9]|uniref:Tetratricopeptide repeat protein n=2 Tax=Leadbettera azotonutricia TaxID=150829 RepID=F5YG70_LEAAZ|nr:conserved hypothetical protein [Leadbettera azotonutricia ZAS-9]